MSEARRAILEALASAPPRPSVEIRRVPAPPMPEDALAVLRDRLEQAGGRLEQATAGDWPTGIEWPIALEDAAHVYSTLPELAGRGRGLDPTNAAELDGLDICAIRGEWVVVESGAVWHAPRDPIERAAVLLAEHVVIRVAADALLATLHDLYARLDLAETAFGWLLCGPSKTADIEQALVLGAHGARSATLVLVEDDAVSAMPGPPSTST